MSDDLKNHLKELGEVSGKIFQDIKKSITSMINDYKEKQASKQGPDADKPDVSKKPTTDEKTKTAKAETVVPKEEPKVEPKAEPKEDPKK